MEGVTVDAACATSALFASPVITTALLPFIGYHRAEILARHMQQNGVDLFEANEALGMMDDRMLKKMMTPAFLLKLGYKMSDVMDAKKGGEDA